MCHKVISYKIKLKTVQENIIEMGSFMYQMTHKQTLNLPLIWWKFNHKFYIDQSHLSN